MRFPRADGVFNQGDRYTDKSKTEKKKKTIEKLRNKAKKQFCSRGM